VSATEFDGLAALEVALVGAAAAQAQRRRRRRTRLVVLAAVAAPLTLAAAGSIASTGFFRGVDRNLAMLRDERLRPASQATVGIATAMGARPRDEQSERVFRVGGHKVVAYTTAGGQFCYAFAKSTGGCMPPTSLSDARPVGWTVDHGARVFRFYGIAIDDVTSITVRIRGVTHSVTLGHNAFFFASKALGNTDAFTFTMILGFRDGTTREQTVSVSEAKTTRLHVTRKLPGVLTSAKDAVA